MYSSSSVDVVVVVGAAAAAAFGERPYCVLLRNCVLSPVFLRCDQNDIIQRSHHIIIFQSERIQASGGYEDRVDVTVGF